MTNLDKLKYPIGVFVAPAKISDTQKNEWIKDIKSLPNQLREAVKELTINDLKKPYRPGGWTVRQLVHHISDSHINCFIRFKLALTEDNPTIRPYEQDLWATLSDNDLDIDVSLDLLSIIHQKWVHIIERMNEEELERTFYHPANDETISLRTAIGLYAWHGKHHLAHIKGMPRD